jgi:hypothetical protein
MKTTVDLPDELYRRVKSQAALGGQSVKSFLLDALREKLKDKRKPSGDRRGWRSVFGAARGSEVAVIQRIIDKEFSRIDAEGW